MRFTSNHGWPVAEDTDVVKQYPTTIDQPFKDALDVQMMGKSNYRGMRVYWDYGAIPPIDVDVLLTPLSLTVFGADPALGSISGQTVTLNEEGRYLISCQFNAGSSHSQSNTLSLAVVSSSAIKVTFTLGGGRHMWRIIINDEVFGEVAEYYATPPGADFATCLGEIYKMGEMDDR